MVSRKLAAATNLGFAALLFLTSATLGLPSSANNGPDSRPVSAQDRESAAQKFVFQRLHVWQDRLNLKDWKLEVKLLRTSQLEPRTMGNIRWDMDARQATIGVLSSYDYNMPWQAMLDDMEFTIVHEMVHLHLASLPRSEASRRNEEHAVNEIATALLGLARR